MISVGEATTDDYTFVVPIFGDPRYFRNGDYLWKYRANVLLAVNVDSPRMEHFVDDLRARGRVSCPELDFDALRSVETSFVIRIDGDTVSRDDPGRIVAAVRAAGADLCSVKVTVSRRETLIEKLQAVEYDLAMLG